MFGLLPSVYGIGAGLIFLLIAYVDIRSDGLDFSSLSSWTLPISFVVLGVAFIIRHLPKFILLSFINLLAHALAALGVLLFVIYLSAVWPE